MHGLITDADGELGSIMLELGHLETYLTRKLHNKTDFTNLPYEQGSIFAQILQNSDALDLDNLDRNLFKVRAVRLFKNGIK